MSSSESTCWAEHPDLVAFYTQHRNRPEDLYPSERRFLPWLATQATSVLDVGCAAGGFSNIWRYYHPQISYVGVDVSTPLIDLARKFHDDLKFHQGNCAEGLSLPDRCATVVSALGWLHWEPRYREAIKELWRLTDRYLFFDVRLVSDRDAVVSGKQQISFLGAWDGKTTTPYVAIAWPVLAEMLLDFQPIRILGHGYWGQPAETVMDIDQPICFAAFILEKGVVGKGPIGTSVCLDLPFAWPETLIERVELLSTAQLEDLVPRHREK